MKRLFRFNREEDDFGVWRWYIDLPEWEGSKADLEMVSGADVMLETLSEGESHCWIVIHTDDNDIGHSDYWLCKQDDNGNYSLTGIGWALEELEDLDVWLCPVTKFVFGEYPDSIYLKVV